MTIQRKTVLARIQANAASHAKEEQIRNEVIRLFGLEPRWLARSLLRLVRQLRITIETPGIDECSAIHQLYWHLIPEVARRLGEGHMRMSEHADPATRNLTDSALRQLTISTWKTAIAANDRQGNPHILFRRVEDGNPLMIALDRLCPPSHQDAIAQHLRTVATARGADCANGTWSLSLLG